MQSKNISELQLKIRIISETSQKLMSRPTAGDRFLGSKVDEYTFLKAQYVPDSKVQPD